MSFGTSLGLGAALTISASTNFSIDTSKSRETQVLDSITEVITDDGAMVQPGQTIKFELYKRYLNEVVQWEMPLRFRGRIGADYGKKYNGHYFWSIPANKFFYEYQWSGEYLAETETTISPEYQVRISFY
ncbi:hypothetical protein [Vibrio jasicida]|uniref:hypothetical protein n=1 Tax=Vibrio jasicida TaxID=766224 RepID=UPI000CE36D4F|nr:hypothetical protein [Vibrio jasicida]